MRRLSQSRPGLKVQLLTDPSATTGPVASRFRALTEKFGNPYTWSDIEKCLLVTGAIIPFQIVIIYFAQDILKHPSNIPFVDPNYVPIFLWFQIIALFATLGLFLACLVLRKERMPIPALTQITIQLYTLWLSYNCYVLGMYTSPVSGAAIAALIAGSLIFDWRQVFWGALSGTLIAAGIAAASQLHLLPYAPLISGQIVTDGFMSNWWFTRVVIPTVAFAVASMTLFFYICAQWRVREERLEAANRELTANQTDLTELNLEMQIQGAELSDANDALRRREEELSLANAELKDREDRLTAAYTDLRKSHARLAQFEKAVATAPVGITICDTNGKIVYTNRAEAEMHGYSPDELAGKPASILAPNKPSDPLTKDDLKVLGAFKRESLNLRKNGSLFPVQLISDVIRDPRGEPLGIVTVSEDITHRKEIEKQLRQSEQRYALAIQGASDGIWDWDLIADRVFFSERWKTMLGCTDEEIGDSPLDWLNRIHPEEREQVKFRLAAHIEGKTPQFETEYRILHKDGDYRWFLARGLAVRDAMGRAVRMAGSQTDITDKSLLDPLTGLPNRTLFMDRLRRAFERAERDPNRVFALLLLGLNRFNNVNETLGRKVGDQLLFMVAARIQQKLGTVNTVARLGGDEFTILVEELKNPDEAKLVADQLLDEIKNPFKLYGREIFITASIGIAPYSGTSERPEDLLRDADTAMRRAKTSGTTKHQMFDADMRRIAMTRFELESDLRRAVERSELILDYQPIVSLKNSRTIGFEALVRWNHPTRGLLPPLEFISLAEETGQINAVGLWVLQEACFQMQRWHDRYSEQWPLTMSVNLSGTQFTQPDLLHRIESVLKESRLDRQSLKLEITESILMHDAMSAAETLVKLKELGIKLCMDDFGTGYSSLSYLNRFPFDTMKIDKSFVHRINESEADVEIVRAMVSLAHNLGMDVVAEGVENEAQMIALAECDCDYAQGYYYSRPVGRDAAEKLFGGHSGSGHTPPKRQMDD